MRQLKKRYNEKSRYFHPFGTTAANVEAKDGGFSDASGRGGCRGILETSEILKVFKILKILGPLETLEILKSLEVPKALETTRILEILEVFQY